MKFKIGDKVYLREDSRWNNGDITNPLCIVGTIDRVEADKYMCDYGVMWSNGIHNRCYEDDDLMLATEETPTLSNFTQEDYDEMQDRIELLESLLVDANNRIVDLEAFDKPIAAYTLEDWQTAMREKWVFQLNNGTKVYVNGIMDEFRDRTHPIELSNVGDNEHVCTVTVRGYMFTDRPNHNCSVNCRIK